jgi:hypothetical protein
VVRCGGVGLAAVAAGPGEGVAADGLQVGVFGGDADVPKRVGDIPGRPRGLAAEAVAEQMELTVRERADVGTIGRAEAGEGVVPSGSQVGLR